MLCIIIILYFILAQNDILVAQSKVDIRLSLSQSEYSDWKNGNSSAIDFNSMLENKLKKEFWKFRSELNYRLLFGIQKRSLSDTSSYFIIPTDNEIISEAMITYPVNWKVDPYFSINVHTQITESFKIVGIKYLRTAKFWDPVITQEALGFTYSYSNITVNWPCRLGLAMKQIRANEYTFQTDNPKTPKINERYKTDAGIETVQEYNINLDSSSYYKGHFALYRILSTDLNKWSMQWENEINHIFWKYCGVIIRFQFIYDDTQNKKVQFKESFSIGLVHSF